MRETVSAKPVARACSIQSHYCHHCHQLWGLPLLVGCERSLRAAVGESPFFTPHPVWLWTRGTAGMGDTPTYLTGCVQCGWPNTVTISHMQPVIYVIHWKFSVLVTVCLTGAQGPHVTGAHPTAQGKG